MLGMVSAARRVHATVSKHSVHRAGLTGARASRLCVSGGLVVRVQAYASLPAGNWTFEVRATDAAGNTEAAAWPTHSWALAIAAYVNLVGGDVGATVTRYTVFTFRKP